MVEGGKQTTVAVNIEPGMTRSSSSKVLWLLAVGCVGVIFLSLLPILLSPQPPAGTLDLRVAGRPQMTNGAMLFTLVLSNGTSRTLNIIDDTAGKPLFVLDDGNPARSTIGVGLSQMANTLKINLSPGKALTNEVMLTNPPPRFRFLIEARDLEAERRGAIKALIHIVASRVTLRKPTVYRTTTMTLPTSAWIDANVILTTNPAAAVQTPNP